MSLNILFKSVIYLTAIPTIGYVLMNITAPGTDKIKDITKRQTLDDLKRNHLIIEKLREAAGAPPH